LGGGINYAKDSPSFRYKLIYDKKVSLIKTADSEKSLLLIGYENGEVEIFSSNQLNKVYSVGSSIISHKVCPVC
jgi:hypothetical protein